MTTRTSQTTTGTQAQRGIVPQLQNEIQSLQAQFSELERRVFGTGEGGGNGRQGAAGGVRARRATTGATGGNVGGSTGGGRSGTSGSRPWIENLLRQHGEGLTRPQIKQMAIAAGRRLEAGFPNNSLKTMERNRSAQRRGEKYYWAGDIGGTGPVARSGTSRTRTRTKKPIARAMTAAG